ncbi:MAG: hypothetical protein J6Z25_01050 [Opitutales bacterium]|nr:hypothetical protein [Opitutales bacterium]
MLPHPLQVIILGAGKAKQLVENPSLVRVGMEQCTLDWLLCAFGTHAAFTFVGGYKLEEITKRYPQLQFHVNNDWQQTGCNLSLKWSQFDPKIPAFVCYGDILLRPELLEKMRQAGEDASVDAVVAIDSDRSLLTTKPSYERMMGVLHGKKKEYPFVGCVYFQPKVLRILQEQDCFSNHSFQRLSDVLVALGNASVRFQWVDAHGLWAEVLRPVDVARFVLTTKAQTLSTLSKRITKARILPEVYFSVNVWRKHSEEQIETILQTFGKKPLVVRSSSLQEDGFVKANAGKFESVAQVCPNKEAIRKAVETVIRSYGTSQGEDQVLVQPMLENVAVSGVVFTRTLHWAAPYYVVNYDQQDTASVTSGTSKYDETFYHWKTAPIPSHAPWFYPSLYALLQEIEQCTQLDALDVEFAVTQQKELYLFQVRPLTSQHLREIEDEQLQSHLEAAAERFVALQTPPPDIQGDATIFGIMPDWNPAEIVGTKPHTLDISLYQTVITNSIWAQQRAEFGYQDVRPYPLIVNFVGHPYVDVRASIHSFLPASLPKKTTRKLVTFFLARLKQHPAWHDKLEFMVMPTCYAFDFEDRWKEVLLQEAHLSETEYQTYRSALQTLTQSAFEKCDRFYEEMLAIEARFDRIQASSLSTVDQIYVLLQSCTVGTLNFAHLARCGFIASSLLKSFVAKGLLSEEEKDAWLHSIQTITGQFFETTQAALAGKIDRVSVIEKYGHLRPGTYDITSPTYRSNPEKYLFPPSFGYKENTSVPQPLPPSKPFVEALQQTFGLSWEAFHRFLHHAIAGREYSKFIFTRYLSCALDGIQKIGEENGFSAEEMAHVPVSLFESLRLGLESPRDIHSLLKRAIQRGEWLYRVTQSIELPPLLTQKSDFFSFFTQKTLPNFIGNQCAEAPLVYLENSQQIEGERLKGKFVLIEKADPGFDWIFNYQIAGLLTAYGGPNSHMAIRSAEFQIPAAIGIGEALFSSLKSAQFVQLDCIHHRLVVLRS